MPGIPNNQLGKGIGSVAQRIRWGSKLIVVPLYVVAVGLVLVDWPMNITDCGRVGVVLFLVTLKIQNDENKRQLAEKIDRKTETLDHKIDASVGAVWDAGGKATARQIAFDQEHGPPLASVTSLVPRQ
jgi:hypothetical protein